MKAYELIDNTPNEINGFKKATFKYGKENYHFELGSKEETLFYGTLEIGWDDHEFLWYENDKKAYSLYVTLNEDREAEFWYKYMDVLWTDENGETEYDPLDDGYLDDVDSFEEAITEFLSLLS